MKLPALVVLFATGFESPAPESHQVEILTPGRVILATQCDPVFNMGAYGGSLIGDCNLVVSQSRGVPGSGPHGGGSVVQLASFAGLTFTDCQMVGFTRSKLPVVSNVYSFTCEEPSSAKTDR